MLVSLFGPIPKEPFANAYTLAKTVATNVAAAAACSALAFVYFCVAFAAEESRPPMPLGVAVILWSTVLAVAIFGGVMGAVAKSFPWLAILLTPLCLGGSMALSVAGLVDGVYFELGGCASIVFLAGALVGRGLKHWSRSRRPRAA